MSGIWDETIRDNNQETVSEFPTLPEGTYAFEVEKVTGKEYQPKLGSKIGRCAEIDLQLRVEGNGQDVRVFDRLYSDPKTVWKMTAFSKCVGVFEEGMTPGQLLRKAEGAIGKAHVILRPAANGYQARNEIKAYLPQPQAPKAKETRSDDLPF